MQFRLTSDHIDKSAPMCVGGLSFSCVVAADEEEDDESGSQLQLAPGAACKRRRLMSTGAHQPDNLAGHSALSF